MWRPFQFFYGHPYYGSWDGYRVTEYILELHTWRIDNEQWVGFQPN